MFLGILGVVLLPFVIALGVWAVSSIRDKTWVARHRAIPSEPEADVDADEVTQPVRPLPENPLVSKPQAPLSEWVPQKSGPLPPTQSIPRPYQRGSRSVPAQGSKSVPTPSVRSSHTYVTVNRSDDHNMLAHMALGAMIADGLQNDHSDRRSYVDDPSPCHSSGSSYSSDSYSSSDSSCSSDSGSSDW